jgi:hypothetical protein
MQIDTDARDEILRTKSADALVERLYAEIAAQGREIVGLRAIREAADQLHRNAIQAVDHRCISYRVSADLLVNLHKALLAALTQPTEGGQP